MSTNTWFILILAGFVFSTGLGFLMVGFYLFNYLTAIMIFLWKKHYSRSYK